MQEGMGLLQVHPDGVKLEEGESEFLSPIYAEEIHSREVRPPPAFLAHLLTPSSPPISLILPRPSPSPHTSFLISEAVCLFIKHHLPPPRLISSASCTLLHIFWAMCRSKAGVGSCRQRTRRWCTEPSLPISLQDVCGSLWCGCQQQMGALYCS